MDVATQDFVTKLHSAMAALANSLGVSYPYSSTAACAQLPSSVIGSSSSHSGWTLPHSGSFNNSLAQSGSVSASPSHAPGSSFWQTGNGPYWRRGHTGMTTTLHLPNAWVRIDDWGSAHAPEEVTIVSIIPGKPLEAIRTLQLVGQGTNGAVITADCF